jgi:hypothetical protein
MGWQIPAQIEQDIISGKAQYRTFQTGVGGQSILPVPSNAYAVVFGYDFSPAGGGLKYNTTENSAFTSGPRMVLTNFALRWFETQQISFYTGTDYYPFIHHFDAKTIAVPSRIQNNVPAAGGSNNVLINDIYEEIDSTPIARQVYITSDKDITISVGLILTDPVASLNAIPQTNRTPALLTYGGSGQAVATQTDFGPAATPIQFMQPSPKDYQDFGFGLLPNGASGQSFATPDTTRGLLDPSVYLNSLGVNFRDTAACNYFLCLHYALYTESVPEQRG